MLRFSLRDLLLLTVIVALAVGWWLDNRRSSALNAQFRNEILKAQHGMLRLDEQVRILQRRHGQPHKKLPFNPSLWTVEELKEAVANGERQAAAGEDR